MRARATLFIAATIAGVLLTGASAHAGGSAQAVPIIGPAIAVRSLPMVSAYAPSPSVAAPEPEVVEEPVIIETPSPAAQPVVCAAGYVRDLGTHRLWWHSDPDGGYRAATGETMSTGAVDGCETGYLACYDYSAGVLIEVTLPQCPWPEDFTKIDQTPAP